MGWKFYCFFFYFSLLDKPLKSDHCGMEILQDYKAYVKKVLKSDHCGMEILQSINVMVKGEFLLKSDHSRKIEIYLLNEVE